MKPRSRVEAALRGDAVDRPPLSAWGHTYREEWSPADLARVTVERQRRYGWDFVKLQPRAGCFAEAFAAEFKSAGHRLRAPLEVSHPIHSFKDWATLGDGDAGSLALADQVAAVRLTVEALGPDIPVIQTVFSPITVAGYLVGRDKRRAVRDLRRDPDTVLAALDRIGDTLIDFARASVEAGAAGVFYAVSGYASQDMLSPAEYDRWLLPQDRRILASLPAAAWFNVLHLCRGRLHFALARELPAQAVSWSIHDPGNPTLAEGKELGGKAVMGGFAQRTTLARGSAEEVAREAAAAVADTGGRGLLLAPGCSVPPAAPARNIAAMREAVAE